MSHLKNKGQVRHNQSSSAPFLCQNFKSGNANVAISNKFTIIICLESVYFVFFQFLNSWRKRGCQEIPIGERFLAQTLDPKHYGLPDSWTRFSSQSQDILKPTGLSLTNRTTPTITDATGSYKFLLRGTYSVITYSRSGRYSPLTSKPVTLKKPASYVSYDVIEEVLFCF